MEERTHQPTPRRRQKAREKGQAPRSHDLIAAVGLLAAYAAFRVLGPRLWSATSETTRSCLADPHAIDFTMQGLHAALGQWLSVALSATAPIALAVLAAGVAANLFQTGFMLSANPIRPDFNRINPASGLQRFFSVRGIVETAKSCLKLGIVGLVAYGVLRSRQTEIIAAGGMSLPGAMAIFSGIAATLFLRCAVVLLLIGAADFAYQRWEFERSLRMTRKEVRDESRDSEGDPLIRSQRARRRRDLLRQRMTPELAQATVVVTNPIHFAVALRYDDTLAPAPRVVAKGQQALARRIVEIARSHSIPVVENVPVARALYKSTAVGDEIPPALYQAVAEILAAIYRAAQRRWEERA
jgi:flagellar biosynthetic protein FlhB